MLTVRYCHELPATDLLGGMAFSVLTLLDGSPGSLPGFSVNLPGVEDPAGILHERYSARSRLR